MSALYTVRAAAARVARTPRTIEAWIADGSLEVAFVAPETGRRYVLEDDLLAAYRARLLSGKSPKRRHPKRAAAPPAPAAARTRKARAKEAGS